MERTFTAMSEICPCIRCDKYAPKDCPGQCVCKVYKKWYNTTKKKER